MKKILIAVLLVSLLVFAGCQGKEKGGEADGGKLKVMATSTMLLDLVKELGGDKVEATGLMGPGVDPHLYTASAGDVDKLSSADLVIYNGLHLEAQLGEVLKQVESKNVIVVAAAESIPKDMRKPFPESEFDPHVWNDVTLWKYATESTRDALIKADEKNKDYYTKNAEAYLKKLDELDAYIKGRVQEIPEQARVLITAHDAFQYYGAAYGFEVRGLQGISTESEASVNDVKELAQFIADRKIKAIFVETSVPEKNINAVKDAVKAKGFNVEIGGTLFSDSLDEPGKPAGTYLGMMKSNIDTIADALK